MKFYFIAFISTMLIVGTASAQHVNYGIKGGLNLYNINFDNNIDSDMKAGFHAGLIGHIHLANKLALQPEVTYSAQGGHPKFDTSNPKYKLSYINVPVLFQYMFDNGFRIQAGPQLGFLLDSDVGDNGNDINRDLNTLEFGVGLGASYVNPRTGFGLDARYNHGLSNIYDDSAVKATNRGLQFGVFYLFKHRS